METDKESETLNLYIEQQQNKISNLMSSIVMLETKVAYLENEMSKIDTKHADEVAFLKEDYEAEIENLKDINRHYKDELMMLSPRPTLSNKKGSSGTKAKTAKIVTGFDIKGEYDRRKNKKRKGLVRDVLAEQTTIVSSGFDLMANNLAKAEKNRRKGIIHAENSKSVKHNNDLVDKILENVKAPVRKSARPTGATPDRVRKTTILEPKEEPVVITPVRTGLSKGSKLKRN
jgi:phage host-nuclease inhibitor protein Gam